MVPVSAVLFALNVSFMRSTNCVPFSNNLLRLAADCATDSNGKHDISATINTLDIVLFHHLIFSMCLWFYWLLCNIAVCRFDLVCTLAYKTKAQTFAIRYLGSPQAIIKYEKVCAIWHNSQFDYYSSLHFRGGDSDSD